MLMSQESFWIFGIDYLDQCGIEGSGAIELFLTKMNISNEKNVLKILNIAKDKGLVDVGTYTPQTIFSLIYKQNGIE